VNAATKPRIIRFVENVNMGLGHGGLSYLLKQYLKINVDELPMGEMVMCLNRAGDKLKVIGGHGLVLGYLRLKRGRIDKSALQFLPRTFGAGGFNYDEAVKLSIESRLTALPRRSGPLAEAAAKKQAGV
jgi:hypothetical protein